MGKARSTGSSCNDTARDAPPVTARGKLELQTTLRADLIIFDTEREVKALKPDLALAAFEASDFVLVPTITDEKEIANMAGVCQRLETIFRLEEAFKSSAKKSDLKKTLLNPFLIQNADLPASSRE